MCVCVCVCVCVYVRAYVCVRACACVSKLQCYISVPSVSFKIRNVGNTSPRPHDVIQFTSVLHNEGVGYDNSTGIFTSPVNGVYLFTVHLCPYSHQESVYAITVEGEDVVRSARVGKDVHACRTIDALVELSVSHRVWVTCLDDGEEIYQTSNHWNMFTGVIVNY